MLSCRARVVEQQEVEPPSACVGVHTLMCTYRCTRLLACTHFKVQFLIQTLIMSIPQAFLGSPLL